MYLAKRSHSDWWYCCLNCGTDFILGEPFIKHLVELHELDMDGCLDAMLEGRGKFLAHLHRVEKILI